MNFLSRDKKKEKADVPDHFFRDLDIEFLIHELKTPLSIIETGVRTLLKKQEKFGRLSSRQSRTLNRSLKNTIRAREMVHTLLEIGRSEEAVFSFTDFIPGNAVFSSLIDSIEAVSNELFNEIYPLTRVESILSLLEKNSIFLIISETAWNQTIYQDPVKLRQITGNLIKNAFTYRKDRVDISLDIKNGFLIFEIADDGPGIAPENHKSVFERYKQIKTDPIANRPGHGLGLAGSYILAKRLKGDIEILASKHAGALFRVTLPVRTTP